MPAKNHYRVDGTSPPARGKPGSRSTSTARARDIPACTGKTQPHAAGRLPVAGHPRLHGENAQFTVKAGLLSGTSPPARGKLSDRLPVLAPLRDIPACTGKTHRHRHGSAGRSGHPRLHGENSMGSGSGNGWGGTSPPARGKLLRRGTGQAVIRDIPACTGKTLLLSSCAA